MPPPAGSDSIPSVVTASGGKYLLLDVPHYDTASAASQHPRSYIQLGAYPIWGTSTERGDDLLNAVGLEPATSCFFKDDYRDANGQAKSAPAAPYYRDDGTGQVESDAPSLTGELLRGPSGQVARGGWRQHTDGNYLSTTRGDRVDVIRGNYKLAVLGRMDTTSEGTPWGESYWESSGGHSREGTNTPGDLVSISWNEEDERWHTVLETIKGDCIERVQGKAEEHFKGRSIKTFVGAPPADVGTPIPSSAVCSTTPPGGAHMQTDQDTAWLNPSSGFGTGWPRNKTNPTVDATVKAKSITEVTDVAGAITTTTKAKSITSLTLATSLFETTTVDGNVSLTSSMGTAANPLDTHAKLLFAGAAISTEIFGSKSVKSLSRAVFGSGWTFNLTLLACQIEVAAGASSHSHTGDFVFGLNVASSMEYSLSAEAEASVGLLVELKLGSKLELHAAKKYELALLGNGIQVGHKKFLFADTETSLSKFFLGTNHTST